MMFVEEIFEYPNGLNAYIEGLEKFSPNIKGISVATPNPIKPTHKQKARGNKTILESIL